MGAGSFGGTMFLMAETSMPTIEQPRLLPSATRAVSLPVSVIIPVRNEAHNLRRCLESLRGAGEVYVIDSGSTDETIEIARSFDAKVVQFHYRGGWPKKRQWAMDTLPLAYEWVFLMDADEALTPELADEIRQAFANPLYDGYYIALCMHFLGRVLRHSNASFYKLSLFRRVKGRFECRSRNQDASMCDMEVHEHVVVEGRTAKLQNPLVHRNGETLSRYIGKHDGYSTWEAHVWSRAENGSNDLPPSLLGTQAQRRRWLKKRFLGLPGSPVVLFLYRYFFCLGFLDGVPGLIYCGFQAVQLFHTKAKMYELRASKD
jgi:glycosyltransferase involved in cell wall biosynthesis